MNEGYAKQAETEKLRSRIDAMEAKEAKEQYSVETDDPWAHRSTRMKCHTCMWFVEKSTDRPRLDVIGRCRRHAPTLSGYPVVYSSDWCGDHKVKE